MKFSTFLRHFREGAKNIGRNGWMSFASISSISISLFILGVFLLLTFNVNALADQIESQVEIRVFLEVNTKQQQVDELRNEIGTIKEVSKVTYVPKSDGLTFLRDKLGDDGKDLLEGLDGNNNPLPDSFTVEVHNPETVSFVAKKIMAMNETRSPGPIASVKYGKGYVENLFAVTRAVRNIGLFIVFGLAVTAMFLISNTIKITILARRREISVMKLVGATNNFIRWPFFIEGALLGIIGSAIPVTLLFVAYSQLVDQANYDLGLMMISLVSLKSIGLIIAGLLIALGTLIGIWGSTISIRKFLKV